MRAHKLAKFLGIKWVKTSVDLVLTFVTLYFSIQKITDFSLATTAISKWGLNPDLVATIKVVLLAVFSLCAVARLAKVWFDHNPTAIVENPKPELLISCMLVLMKEIEQVRDALRKSDVSSLSEIPVSQNFDTGLGAMASALQRGIIETFPRLKCDPNDVVVTIYSAGGFEKLPRKPIFLEYLTHCPQEKDGVFSSSEIHIEDEKFKEYECVKCIKSGERAAVVFDCSEYAKSGSSRHITVKHYAGWPITWDGSLLGFLNVEFHNKTFFYDAKDYQKYIQEHVLVYKHLIRYHFLKHVFLTWIKGLAQNQSTANENNTAKSKRGVGGR